MPSVTYIEFNGTAHTVEVPVGTSLMRGAVDNNMGDRTRQHRGDGGIDQSDLKERRHALSLIS